MPRIARVYEAGDAQAVRLPEDFQFDSSQVEVTREGDTVILRPHVKHREPWAALKAALAQGMSDDVFADGRQQPEWPRDQDFRLFD